MLHIGGKDHLQEATHETDGAVEFPSQTSHSEARHVGELPKQWEACNHRNEEAHAAEVLLRLTTGSTIKAQLLQVHDKDGGKLEESPANKCDSVQLQKDVFKQME